MEIEIPFGAKDSELMGWEYTIPEDMEAIIKDGKVIVKKKDSEDEKIRKEILDFIQLCLSRTDFGSRSIALRKEDAKMFEKWITYLEKQKEQKPAEWSEEDEEKLGDPINYFEGDTLNCSSKDMVAWLKSLRPQSHWKPSAEQMDALEYFVQKHKAEANAATGIWIDYENLVSLRNDLRKL